MVEATISAKGQSEKIQYTIDPSIPSLIIVMLKSQVGGGFWLGAPTEFCRAFMSKHKIVMTLVDQKKQKLLMPCCAMFKLGDASKNLKRERKPVAKRQRVGDAGKNLKTEEKPAAKRQRRAPLAVIRDENGNQQQPDDNGDVVNSVVGDFESFTKIVKDLVGDSKLPEDVLEKYYNLCCTHNSFLHANICPGHNGQLVAGMIIETVEIVHGIRSCKLHDTFNGEVERFLVNTWIARQCGTNS
ncbi:B3 domain-containing protein Os01g0234100-like [Papaver somniferum]|uniref:B3 domain-containing protein Os01g0234100-like n=1 Tax=Papaver somniferum TaxID=3469 RepID=UPI000E6FE775|nr:B3 domain-containing protein Os01g0234100-like [Papaver somniferum]